MKTLLLEPRLAAPRLETERLILRARIIDDAAPFAALWADPRVTRYIGGQTLTADAAMTKFVRGAGFWALFGYGGWTVEEKASGAYVGDVGHGEFARVLSAGSLVGRPELGWVFAAAFWGKGYASEAVGAAADWGAAHFSDAPQTAMIEVGHVASLRVAEKCGFAEVARATYHGASVILLERAPPMSF